MIKVPIIHRNIENINDIIIVNHKVNSGQSKSMISGALVSKSDICVFIEVGKIMIIY